MILYFDNYITDEPLAKGIYRNLEETRNEESAYRKQDKLSITLYTLASYAEIDWSHVLIKYELADASKNDFFEKSVRELFPDAVIIRGRSDSQKKFRESFDLLKRMGDEWIFYAGNNDHPFISDETRTLKACIEKAAELKKDHRFISVSYSHYPEMISQIRKDSLFHRKDLRILEENADCISVFYPEGDFTSIQVLHIDLFERWFCSADFGDRRIIRGESVHGLVKVEDQVIVLPKKEICTHYDGYSHIRDRVTTDPDELYPPLFIPEGFFEKNIRIAYCYPEYQKGWVNINPCVRHFKFKDRENGTDMRIPLELLPMFWKGRIAVVEKNPACDEKAARKCYDSEAARRMNPWPNNHFYLKYRVKAKKYLKGTKYYIDNPEVLQQGIKVGGSMMLPRRILYGAIMAGYKTGIFKRRK
jgi:hypothetical protein